MIKKGKHIIKIYNSWAQIQKTLNGAFVKNEMILTEWSLHVLCVHQIGDSHETIETPRH